MMAKHKNHPLHKGPPFNKLIGYSAKLPKYEGQCICGSRTRLSTWTQGVRANASCNNCERFVMLLPVKA